MEVRERGNERKVRHREKADDVPFRNGRSSEKAQSDQAAALSHFQILEVVFASGQTAGLGGRMIWFGLLCSLAGAVLGLLFTAYVLIPATVLSLTAVVGLGLVNGLGPWQIVLYAVVIWIALQIGYLAGSAIALASSRTRAEIWRPRAHWWPWVRFSLPGGPHFPL